MSNLPTFDCPVCRNTLSWDVVFAHQGVREAMMALVNAHPDARRLLRPLLGYITLFAPKKTAMRYERVASLANELVGMISAAQIERNGRTYPAPAGYWQQAFDELIARHHAGSLRTPLGSHGYLLEVIAGYAGKAEAKAEAAQENQRAGHAGAGANFAGRTSSMPEKVGAVLPKTEMPNHVREAVKNLTQRCAQTKPTNI
jgi:hypothetical protein